MKNNNLKPFNVCVREYANLHPNYNQLRTEFGKSEIREKTNPIISSVIEKIEADGYKAVNIPCFTEFDIRNENPINYMNGVGGTSENGETYYITNTSGYSELDEVMKQQFKEAGIDRTFFVSTIEFLMNQGGIDCMTQEM